MEVGITLGQISVPRGTFNARVGKTGRLQLPVKVLRYFNQIGDPKGPVFATTLDNKSIRLFSEAGWEVMRRKLDAFEDRGSAETVMQIATGLGQDVDLDEKGRIVLPPRLRRELELEDKDLAITCGEGYATLYDLAVYETRMDAAAKTIDTAAENLSQAGVFNK